MLKKIPDRTVCCRVNFSDDEAPLTNNNDKPGGKMKLDFEDNKFVTYLMISMMGLGFVVMLLM